MITRALHLSLVWLALGPAFTFAADSSVLISSTEKEALRKILNASFVLTSFPKEKDVAANLPVPIPQAKKEGLRKILHGSFALTSFPKEKEEELYRVLNVFDENRKTDELVRSVDFSFENEARVTFSTKRWMHGGGFTILKKKDGVWKAGSKWYGM